jgi:hypothetical protein
MLKQIPDDEDKEAREALGKVFRWLLEYGKKFHENEPRQSKAN